MQCNRLPTISLFELIGRGRNVSLTVPRLNPAGRLLLPPRTPPQTPPPSVARLPKVCNSLGDGNFAAVAAVASAPLVIAFVVAAGVGGRASGAEKKFGASQFS